MKENRSNQYVVFTLDEQRYALHLSSVERVIHAVEITPLPNAPEIVSGVVNLQGEVIPVFNIRKRFRLPERKVDEGDQIIVARTSRRKVALVADATNGVIEHSEQEMVPAEKVLPSIGYVEGVVKLEEGMVLIHNLDKFLLLDEEDRLGKAMR